MSARSLVWRERESKLERAAEEICSSRHPFFVAALRDGGLHVRNDLFFINGVVDGTSAARFLTITFRISPVKYRVYFLVVCLFFPRARIDFQKKLDEKHKKQTSCPYIRKNSQTQPMSMARRPPKSTTDRTEKVPQPDVTREKNVTRVRGLKRTNC